MIPPFSSKKFLTQPLSENFSNSKNYENIPTDLLAITGSISDNS